MDELIKQLREHCQYENCVLCQQAADAIEARDRHILALQHEIMAEAESLAALVERLNKQIEELADVRPMELKPCPFCGDTAVFESFKERKGYAATVHCCGCPAEITTITYDTEKEAETRALWAWNRRAR